MIEILVKTNKGWQKGNVIKVNKKTVLVKLEDGTVIKRRKDLIK